MKNLKKINVEELSFESKIIISGGVDGDAAELLGDYLGWWWGTAKQIAGFAEDVVQSFGVSEPGAGGYTGSKL